MVARLTLISTNISIPYGLSDKKVRLKYWHWKTQVNAYNSSIRVCIVLGSFALPSHDVSIFQTK
jgi:hypothetical protein